MVVTDGELDKEAETTLRHFADSGITLVGIGVGISLCYRSKFRDNFAINVIIDDFEKLQETLMNLAKQLMLEAIH